MALGLATVASTIVLTACSGGAGTPKAADDVRDTHTSTTSTAVPSPPTSPATKGAPAIGSRPPATSVRPAAVNQTQPFVADTKPDVSTERDGFPVLASVSKGLHDGYVRYVFQFNHADPEGHQPWLQYARPAWDVRYVPASQAVHDGSGDPVYNAGAKAHLKVRFEADMHDTDGHSTLTSSFGDEEGMVFGGDFEGRVTWFYGSDAERPFRVMYVGEGRVAVDVVTEASA
ncbi:MAG: hypothetical protein M3011_13075 [Actinomycetota bacterium]|nr:hypothetical protein [Actinomycetota bacterium]